MAKILGLLCIAVLAKCFMAQNTQLDHPEIAMKEHPDRGPEQTETDINNDPDDKKFVVCTTPPSVVAAILKGMKEETIKAAKRGSSTPAYYTPVGGKEDIELASGRYAPLCIVFFRRDSKRFGFWPHTDKGTCSCAFIGPSLVITAAHCFTKVGVKCKPEDKNPWVIVVVQKYGLGGEKNRASHMQTHRRLVTRWWYSKSYFVKTDVQHDFAFMETNEPNVDGKFYKFQPLDYKKQVEKLHSGKTILESVGYPGNYLNSEVAVRVTGEYQDPPLSRQFAVLQRKDGPIAGNGRGASGGPILFNQESLNKLSEEDRKEKEMWLVGLNSFANDEEIPSWTRSPKFYDDYAFKARDIKLPAQVKNAAEATDPLKADNVEAIVSTA